MGLCRQKVNKTKFRMTGYSAAYAKFERRTKLATSKLQCNTALRVPEIIGGTGKILSVPRYPHAPFSRKFLTGFFSHGRSEYTCQI